MVMYYVKRDEEGKITGLYGTKQPTVSEVLPEEHEDIQRFLYPEKYDLDVFLQKVREKRDQILNETIWMYERHKSQIDLGVDTDITVEDLPTWLQYWQDLRDIPNTIAAIPDNGIDDITFPTRPDAQ